MNLNSLTRRALTLGAFATFAAPLSRSVVDASRALPA